VIYRRTDTEPGRFWGNRRWPRGTAPKTRPDALHGVSVPSNGVLARTVQTHVVERVSTQMSIPLRRIYSQSPVRLEDLPAHLMRDENGSIIDFLSCCSQRIIASCPKCHHFDASPVTKRSGRRLPQFIPRVIHSFCGQYPFFLSVSIIRCISEK